MAQRQKYTCFPANEDTAFNMEAVGKINSKEFKGHPPRTVLCTSCKAERNKSTEFIFTVLNADDILALKGVPVSRVYDAMDFNTIIKKT